MTFGLYILTTLVMLLMFGIWMRSLVVRRLKPERILSDLTGVVRNLIADLNQTGDHNISVLEDRIATLSDLIRRADHQIDDARMLLEHLSTGNYRVPPASETTPQDGPHDFDAGDAEDTTVESRSDHREAPVEPGPDLENQEREEPVGDEQSRRSKVLSLYQQGVSADLIAARTGIAIGEVELIISLQEKRVWR